MSPAADCRWRNPAMQSVQSKTHREVTWSGKLPSDCRVSRFGETTLPWAVARRNGIPVRRLMDNGTERNPQDENGATARQHMAHPHLYRNRMGTRSGASAATAQTLLCPQFAMHQSTHPQLVASTVLFRIGENHGRGQAANMRKSSASCSERRTLTIKAFRCRKRSSCWR